MANDSGGVEQVKYNTIALGSLGKMAGDVFERHDEGSLGKMAVSCRLNPSPWHIKMRRVAGEEEKMGQEAAQGEKCSSANNMHTKKRVPQGEYGKARKTSYSTRPWWSDHRGKLMNCKRREILLSPSDEYRSFGCAVEGSLKQPGRY